MFSDHFISFPYALEIEAKFILVQIFPTNLLLVISLYLNNKTAL